MVSESSAEPVCYINGKRHVLPGGRAEATLLQYLRESGLTGTKLGCGEGGCGACTVMVSSFEDGQLLHRSINACLCPLYAVEGMHVVTVEGIGNARDGLHPVQEKLSKAHGSQCGFCTPGFVMSMYSLLRSKSEAPTHEEIEDALAGNLCRCTGYRPILAAFNEFAKTDNAAYVGAAVNGAAKICPSSGLPCDCAANGSAADTTNGTTSASNGCGSNGCGNKGCCGAGGEPTTPQDAAAVAPHPEPIFPAELKKRVAAELMLPGPKASWYRPTSVDSLLKLKSKFPHAKLVVGNTEVGIEMKFKDAQYPVLVATTHIPELNAVEIGEEGVTLGASVTLTKLLNTCREIIANKESYKVSPFKAIEQQLRWFAGNQIRNAASIGGNIATASPISDLNPLWVACGAVFTVAGQKTGLRKIKAQDFFLGYRKTAMDADEIIYQLFVPYTRQYEYVKEYKQAHRREDDIAIVNAGMRVKLEPQQDGWLCEDMHISYGGVAPKTVSAPHTMSSIKGKLWSEETMKTALEAVRKDIVIDANAPGGMVEYRQSLAGSFLFKFFVNVAAQLEAEQQPDNVPQFPESYRSAADELTRPTSFGLQYFDEVAPDSIVGQSYRHMSADIQVTGEAKYTDDIAVPGCLHAAIVKSQMSHARILSIDASEALKVEGVAGFVSAKDIPGHNKYHVAIEDEEVYASQLVTTVGQAIGVLAATTEDIARAAAKLVKVEYEELPAVYSIKDAIEAQSFFKEYGGGSKTIETGDVDAAFSNGSCDNIITGEFSIGGQEHFYLEPQGAIAIPGEEGEMLCYASTQGPAHHQHVIASALGIQQHKVVVKTKRIGGGFGGKESRATFVNAIVAVPAYLLKRPVRLILDRDEDMSITGHRHPFYCKYKVGFKGDGRVVAVDMELYNNGGNTMDLSVGVMDRALLHADSCYKVDNFRVTGRICKTNLPSNTAFRGFGGPQGMLCCEAWLEHVARVVGRTPEDLRAMHLYQEGDIAHFGQALEGCQIRRCWDEVVSSADYHQRLAAVHEFNQKNRFRKRGISVMPTKFGIAYTTKWLNQGGALVHLYIDGSVLVTHGGVEMGQGLHTKVAQVAAQALGVPLNQVFISETSTDKVPNASPTAASASSDLYGAAVADACAQLNNRLQPYRDSHPGCPFRQIVLSAHLDRVDLSAHGFYKTPDVTGFGGQFPFNYLCYGAACAEVEVDTLTGDFSVLRSDIVMDVGKSLNPAIDVGQVEGAFVQGMGWSCIEEVVWGDKDHKWVRPGRLFTAGPGTYKIPTANDIPVDFRVTLLRNAPCHRTPEVHSSKAVGEPPLYLGAAVFWAVKEAIYAARKDAGVDGYFLLDSPATPERRRMTCCDDITAAYVKPDFVAKISC